MNFLSVHIRTLLLAGVTVCIFLFSCKKDQTKIEQESAKKQLIEFKITDFSFTVEPVESSRSLKLMSAKDSSSSLSNLNSLFYIVYNSKGEEVSRIRQEANGQTFKYYNFVFDPDPSEYIGTRPFGTIIDSLPAGDTYSIVFAAAKSRISINTEPYFDAIFYNLDRAFFLYDIPFDLYTRPFARSSDTFFKKIMLTVGTQNITQPVALERVVGKIELNIKDAIPVNAHHFDFYFINENDAYMFGPEMSTRRTDSTVNEGITLIPEACKGKLGYKYEKYIINTATPIDLLVRCYDSQNQLIVEKIIKNIRVYKNKRTILQGNLFSQPPAESTFSISLDSDWDEDSEVINF